MRKPPILVVDDDPITSRMFDEAVSIDGYTCRREADLRNAFTFLRECEWPYIVLVRYVMPYAFHEFDWYAQLVESPRLQRHAYIEAWHCYEWPEDESHRPIQKRFGVQLLPCPGNARKLMDALDKAVENARARLTSSSR